MTFINKSDEKKVKKSIRIKKDTKDKLGMKIRKGTIIHILKEVKHPRTNKKEYLIAVDNGTGYLDLMPKTVVEEKEVKNKMARKKLSIPEQHQLRIARRTLKMPDAMVGIMGGPNKEESREIIKRRKRGGGK
tara:strand:- start:561 stop:956 length:396 start_codon:yes stop_codon:yes gene_type:complete